MKKAFRFSVLFILLILLVAYVGGIYIFSQYYLPKTYVNNVDVSLTKISELEKTYNSKHKGYELEIVSRKNSEKIKASDFEYKDTLEKNQHVDQNPFYWMFSIFVPKNHELKHNISYNEEKFNNTINNLNIFKEEVVEPVDAKVVFKDGKFVIEKEVVGNKINKEELNKKVLEYVSESKNKLDLEKEKIYYEPKLKENNEGLIRLAENKNKINSFKITYNFDDRKEVLENEVLLNLYKENGKQMLVPDEEKVKNYVIGLSEKYDTFKSTRQFQTTGAGIAQIDGGIYGWSTDIEESTKELMKALNKEETVEINPVYKMEANSRKTNDIGDSYIEIDLARQKMWMYIDKNPIIETSIVTGNPNRGNGTPTGVGKIWSRERDRYLTGEGYNSHVDYWLPINWSGVGIHDSSWRSDYGGSIYLSRGSHGCINTPPNVMPEFFKNTFNGMPVVIYDSNTQIISQ